MFPISVFITFITGYQIDIPTCCPVSAVLTKVTIPVVVFFSPARIEREKLVVNSEEVDKPKIRVPVPYTNEELYMKQKTQLKSI